MASGSGASDAASFIPEVIRGLVPARHVDLVNGIFSLYDTSTHMRYITHSDMHWPPHEALWCNDKWLREGFVQDVVDLLAKQFRELGFRYVTLDLHGFRSGAMNEILNSNS